MPRKKTKKPVQPPVQPVQTTTPTTAPAPPKSSKLGCVLAVIAVLFILWFFFSMLRFFLPMAAMPFFSLLGQMSQMGQMGRIPGYFDSGQAPTLKAPAPYKISQVDNYPISMSVNIPWFNMESRGNFNVVSQGLPVSLANPDDPDWKTEWKVYQDMVYQADLDGAVRKEVKEPGRYFLIDIPGKNIKAKSSGRTVLTFSLMGVREGDTFQIKSENSGTESEMASPDQETKLIKRDEAGNWDYRGSVNYNDQQKYQDKTFTFTGKLVKDNGEAGAEITIGSMDLPKEYKDAALMARDLARKYNAPGGLQNLYDDSGKINNDSGIAQMDYPQNKPLRIFLDAEGSNK